MNRFLVGCIGIAVGLFLVAAAVADDKKPTEIKGWGTVLDPDGDCSITEDKGKVTIKVPGSHHDLYIKKLNAPRVWQEFEGDFVAQVKVTADWKPGARLPKVPTVPYNGAGLLVWDSEKHFVRWERSMMIQSISGKPSYRSFTTPLENKDGRQLPGTMTTDQEFFKGRSTWLRAERVGDKLTTFFSHDGKEWQETAALTPAFPKTVRVGVEAINNTASEFVVEFEEFKVSKK